MTGARDLDQLDQVGSGGGEPPGGIDGNGLVLGSVDHQHRNGQ